MALLYEVCIREMDDYNDLSGVTITGLTWDGVQRLVESTNPEFNDLVFTIYPQRENKTRTTRCE